MPIANCVDTTIFVMTTPKSKTTTKKPSTKKSPSGMTKPITENEIFRIRLDALTTTYIDLADDAEITSHRSTVGVVLSIISTALSLGLTIIEVIRHF